MTQTKAPFLAGLRSSALPEALEAAGIKFIDENGEGAGGAAKEQEVVNVKEPWPLVASFIDRI
jgi:hypothetical protein